MRPRTGQSRNTGLGDQQGAPTVQTQNAGGGKQKPGGSAKARTEGAGPPRLLSGQQRPPLNLTSSSSRG